MIPSLSQLSLRGQSSLPWLPDFIIIKPIVPIEELIKEVKQQIYFFLLGESSAEMTWQVCWWLSHLNGKSTVYWPHAGTTTHRMGARTRVNSSGQHRRLNGELSLEWFQRDKVSHLKTQKHVKADRLGCRWRTGRNDSLMWALIYSKKISLSALFFLNVWKLLKNCPKQRKHTSF